MQANCCSYALAKRPPASRSSSRATISQRPTSNQPFEDSKISGSSLQSRASSCVAVRRTSGLSSEEARSFRILKVPGSSFHCGSNAHATRVAPKKLIQRCREQNLLFRHVLSMLSCRMAQLLVRHLEEEVVQALRQKAAEEGTSVEEAHRRLLRSVLLSKKSTKTFKEALLEMPDDGDDSIFERVRRAPRKIVL